MDAEFKDDAPDAPKISPTDKELVAKAANLAEKLAFLITESFPGLMSANPKVVGIYSGMISEVLGASLGGVYLRQGPAAFNVVLGMITEGAKVTAHETSKLAAGQLLG